MSDPELDLRQINYFICLSEERNFTRAARKLHVVQPALSMQIQRLEQKVGATLFERTSRGVVPTAAGEAMYNLYLPIVLDLRDANRRMMELSGKVLGRISIGVIPSITNSVLADVLRHFAARFPDVELRIDEAYAGTLVDWVAAGDLDLAIVNRTPRRAGLASKRLVEEELLFVERRSRERRPLKPITFDALVSKKLVLPSRRHGLRMIIEQAAEKEGLTIAPRFEVDALGPTLRIVAAGDLAAVLPEVVVHKAVTELDLQARRIVKPRLIRELSYVHRVQRPLSAASAKFVELLAQELQRTFRKLAPRNLLHERSPEAAPAEL